MPLIFEDRAPTRFSRILFIAFLLISAILMSVYSMEGPTGTLHTLQNNFSSVVLPLEATSARAGSVIENAESMVSDAQADPNHISDLKAQNAELKETLTKAEEYRQENERLKELLEIKDEYKIDTVSGRIIGRSYDAWNQTITLDIGSDEGVSAGYTVLGTSGVIGQVSSVSASSCVVRLLTDPQSGVATMIQSSRAEGIVRGSLSGLLYLEDIDNGVGISEGDVVLTSGLGGSFQKGLLIGTVVRIDGSTASNSRRVVVAQNSTPVAFEEVLVVMSARDFSAAESDAKASGSDKSASSKGGE